MMNSEIEKAPDGPMADSSTDAHTGAENSADIAEQEQINNSSIITDDYTSTDYDASQSTSVANAKTYKKSNEDDIDFGSTKKQIWRNVVRYYLDTIDKDNPPSPDVMEKEILKLVRDAFDLECSMMPNKEKWPKPTELTPSAIADIVLNRHNVKRIAGVGLNSPDKHDILVTYCDSGPNKGIYVESENEIALLAEKYNFGITREGIKELISILCRRAPRLELCNDKDLIAVNNGVFDYRIKQLLDFAPGLVFMSKSYVDYNPNAQNVNLHNDEDGTDWNVEDWMSELSDDPEIVNLIWEITGAIIRPRVSWNKSAFLYSEVGNNGKGSLCELMRNICGNGAYAQIPLDSFKNDFLLEDLTHSTAIIADENGVGIFLDKLEKMKLVITGEPFTLNRKYQSAIKCVFKGFMVQCLNDFPMSKDKTNSWYRRQLFVPFDKCFTGIERKYIKDEYLKNKDVLEYVLYKVLNMNYYELSEPKACRAVLEEYKQYNDPIRQFWGEIESRLVWDFCPSGFLYDLFCAWFARNNPSGTVPGSRKLTLELRNLTKDVWEHKNSDHKQTIGGNATTLKMDKPEPLIHEYDLNHWKNPNYRGTDPKKISSPTFDASYVGFLRIGSS